MPKAIRVADDVTPHLEREAKVRKVAATVIVNDVLRERYELVVAKAKQRTPTDTGSLRASALGDARRRVEIPKGKCQPSCPPSRRIGGICMQCGSKTS